MPSSFVSSFLSFPSFFSLLFRLRFPLVAAFFFVGSPVLAQGSGQEKGSSIVASVPYAADLVRVLSCREAPPAVETIVPAGKDPHGYSPLPADRARMASASLFLFVHPGFETWLPKRIRAGKRGANDAAFALAEGLALKGNDPHIWHSPALTVEASRRLAQRLGAVLPARASEFMACHELFEAAVKKEVDALKALIATSLPEPKRWLATNHDAFGYFAEAFGFRVLAVQGLSTEASPTPARLRAVIDGVKKSGAKAVFLEASVPARTMERVAKEAGVRLGGSLAADGLGEPGSGAETTLALWRKNVETVVSALK